MLSTKLLLKSVMAMAVASLMVFTTGCEDDDKDAPTGTSTVRGEVSAVSADYVPGIVAGITVHLVGPVTLKTVSDERGLFEFTNVPAGDFVLIFYVNGGQATKEITIGEGETTVLAHVTVKANGDVVVTTDVTVAPAPEPEPEAPAIINVAGSWTLIPAVHVIKRRADDEEYVEGYRLNLQQDGTTLSGTMTHQRFENSVVPGYAAPEYRVTGTLIGTAIELDFAVLPSGMAYVESLSGTVNAAGTSMSVTLTADNGGTSSWTATPADG